MKDLLIALDQNLEGLLELIELFEEAKPYSNDDITTEENRTKANLRFFLSAYAWIESLLGDLDGRLTSHIIVSIKGDSVILKSNGEKIIEYNTGDIVTDFAEAIEYAHEHALMVSYSSSVDNYVMDNDGYYFDENDLIKRNKTNEKV